MAVGEHCHFVHGLACHFVHGLAARTLCRLLEGLLLRPRGRHVGWTAHRGLNLSDISIVVSRKLGISLVLGFSGQNRDSDEKGTLLGGSFGFLARQHKH